MEEYTKEWFVNKLNGIKYVHIAGLNLVKQLTLGTLAENQEAHKMLIEPLEKMLLGVNEEYENEKKQLEMDWQNFYVKDYDGQTFQNFVDSLSLCERNH